MLRVFLLFFSFLVLDGGQRRWNLNVEQEGQRMVDYMLMEVVARLLYLRQFVVSSDSWAKEQDEMVSVVFSGPGSAAIVGHLHARLRDKLSAALGRVI